MKKKNKIEEEIVKILKPTGTKEIEFTDEENARLSAIQGNESDCFTVYVYKNECFVIINGETDRSLYCFSKEFKQELLNILKNKNK